MKTLRISVDQISEYSFLEFGERGENAVTEVILDFAAWVEEFGEGIVNLYVKRGGDTSAYPVPLSVDGTVATWLVSDTDTYKKGRGEAEYVYVVGEKIEKTAVFGFYVNRDIGQPATTPPSPYETWVESLMDLSNTTLQNAQDAENSAEKAETAAQHYPIIVDEYWWVWRVEEEAYVNTGVKAEGQGFMVKGTVATVDDLPSDATQGDYWNVGTHEPYTMYMYQDGVGWLSQGTLKGPTGTTFTPSVSEEGVISWTNDGELPNPEPRSIRGPQGLDGEKGETGDAAGFGQPTATVDQSTGQASVEVSASGPDTAKVFNFAFSGIKGEQGIRGEKGDTGDAAGFGQPTASVDANVGTPSVTVTSSGPDTAKVFDFQFKNMKGNKGDTGNGIADVSLISTSGLDKTYRVTFTESEPFDFVVHDGRGISSVTLNNDYTLTINFTDGTKYTTDRSIRGEKGETGEKGDTGLPAGFGTPTASVDANTGTPSVTVTASGPDTAKVFNFQFKNLKGTDGRNGDKGDTGNGISGISLVSTSGLDKTYRVTFTDLDPFDFVVHDGRGISAVVLNADYTLTINFTDGTNYTTASIRGEKGEKGEPGKNFTVEDYVATPADLPSGVEVGTVYGVGTSEPYEIYVYSASNGWVNNGTIQGPRGATGTTFTPTVNADGVISWTNDGGLPNPASVTIKGEQGEQGETGEAAGFGVPTATTDQTTGQASVSVSASGPDTAKVFNFEFSGIKGEKGNDGAAAGFGTPTASVDANVGTPSVTVTSSGPNTAKVFDFQFKNMKGQKGDSGEKGDTGTTFTPAVSSAGVISWTNDGGLPNPSSVNIKGQQGEKGDTGDAAGFGTPTASVDQTVGTPSVSVSATGPNTAKVFSFQFSGIKGEIGGKGDTGDTGTTFTPSVSNEGVISWTNDGGKQNPSSVNIKGPQGNTGAAAGFGTPTASVDANVGTPSVTVTSSGPNTAKVFDFQFKNIKGERGEQGLKGDTGNGITGVSLVSTSGLDKTYRITFAETSPFEFVVHDGRGISSVVLNSDYTLTINFTDGTNWTTPNSIRGEKGETGQKGDTGDTGTTFTPAVSSEGVISWTNDGGKTNPQSVNIRGPQGVQGEAGTDGVTFTPSVSSEGVVSWTNDGGKENPSPVNIKGPQGNPGSSAGFGTPTASVDQTVGTPSVVITATGPDTARVFDFQFSGLKGETGQQGPRGETGETGAAGAAAGFGTPTATVGTGAGTPSVSVTASGPDTAKVFNFAFDGLKGTPGTNGQGVPTGGTTGQVLKKSSNSDYATEWADESGGGGYFTVKFTGSTYNGARQTADKTFNEILAAYQGGYTVIGKKSDKIYQLSQKNSNSTLFYFQRVDTQDSSYRQCTLIESLNITSGDSAYYYSQARYEKKPLIIHLLCDGDETYQDQPSGVFTASIDSGGQLIEMYQACVGDSVQYSNVFLVYGDYTSGAISDPFTGERYSAVFATAQEEYEDNTGNQIENISITFRVLSKRGSTVVMKTVVVSGDGYYDLYDRAEPTATYSETVLAVQS